MSTAQNSPSKQPVHTPTPNLVFAPGFKQDEVVGRKLDDLFENSLGQPLQGEKLLVDAVAENKACCIR